MSGKNVAQNPYPDTVKWVKSGYLIYGGITEEARTWFERIFICITEDENWEGNNERDRF